MRVLNDHGQATVLTAVMLVVLLGMAALVLDIGAWYRADRAAQSTADAAALAGAQALPSSPSNADTLAIQYADKNGSGVSLGDIAVSSGRMPNDTIRVNLSRPSGGVFTKLFGVSSINVGAKATARASLMDEARYVAPIGVNILNPKLKGTMTCPCFGPGQPATLPLGKVGAPGAFDVLNLDGSKGGTGPGTLSSWILHGFDAYLPLGDYPSDPGAKWNSSQVGSALTARLNTDLLFPVYDTVTGSGANAKYHVIGWVGFHMTSHEEHGSSGSITGWFTDVVWDGITVSSAPDTQPNLSARTVQLID